MKSLDTSDAKIKLYKLSFPKDQEKVKIEGFIRIWVVMENKSKQAHTVHISREVSQ